MRISDWSSDVCSSDLHGLQPTSRQPAPEPAPAVANYLLTAMHDHGNCHARPDKQRDLWRTALVANPKWGTKRICQSCGTKFYDLTRSEEHTSELQSLIRRSSAVFC